RETWDDAIARALAAYPQAIAGVPRTESTALLARMATRMFADVMRTPLPAGGAAANDRRSPIVLGTLSPERCLTELEFHLPSPRVSAQSLNSTLEQLGYAVPRLAFRDLEGYLNGYIDLVFEHDGRYYVLDWKSNHL